MTITTVGYGDRFPVSTAGRLVGIIVMTTGVGVFATFAGFLSNKLLTPSEEKEEELSEFEKSMTTGIEELKQYMKERETRENEISARLERLERHLASGSADPAKRQQDTGMYKSRKGVTVPIIFLTSNRTMEQKQP